MKGSNHQISIVLIDEHEVFRQGLIAQLERHSDLRVVANAHDLETGMDLVLAHKPDVVMMEVLFNGLDPFSVSQTILTRQAKTRIIFLTVCEHDTYIQRALECRAFGYLTKDVSLDMICQAIRASLRGKSYFSPAIKKRVVESSDGAKLAGRKVTRLSTLTSRELQVLRHLAEGMSTREIAETMSISIKTVENHKSNLMTKLAIRDRVKLARFAFREGLVRP